MVAIVSLDGDIRCAKKLNVAARLGNRQEENSVACLKIRFGTGDSSWNRVGKGILVWYAKVLKAKVEDLRKNQNGD